MRLLESACVQTLNGNCGGVKRLLLDQAEGFVGGA
jgi:hypothetical protein